MRSLCMLVLLFLVSGLIYAQDKTLLEVKKGVVLTYQVSVNGQQFPIQMKVDSISPDYTRFGWSMQDGNGGNVINTKPSLDNATHAYWGDLRAGEDQIMTADQSILILSRSSWNALQKDKKFTLDDQEFTVKDQPADAIFKLKDKLVDVVFAQSANGAVRLWILNNPAAPILVKIVGNPVGVDVNLTGVE